MTPALHEQSLPKLVGLCRKWWHVKMDRILQWCSDIYMTPSNDAYLLASLSTAFFFNQQRDIIGPRLPRKE